MSFAAATSLWSGVVVLGLVGGCTVAVELRQPPPDPTVVTWQDAITTRLNATVKCLPTPVQVCIETEEGHVDAGAD